tara:strand:- start:185 stop:430 length:246 start_codon:yes stop_codon:yes gene_type:complete
MKKIFASIILVIVLIFLFQTYKPLLESMQDVEGITCPPVGKSGIVECPNIKDKKLRNMQCEAIKNHCQVLVDSGTEKTILT